MKGQRGGSARTQEEGGMSTCLLLMPPWQTCSQGAEQEGPGKGHVRGMQGWLCESRVPGCPWPLLPLPSAWELLWAGAACLTCPLWLVQREIQHPRDFHLSMHQDRKQLLQHQKTILTAQSPATCPRQELQSQTQLPQVGALIFLQAACPLAALCECASLL